MRLCITGSPLAGKSVLVSAIKKILPDHYDVSSGAIVRKLYANDTTTQLALADGMLAPDEDGIRAVILQYTIDYNDIIIDGFPRFDKQLEYMIDHGVGPDCLIVLGVSEAEGVRRAETRARDPYDTAEVARKRIREASALFSGLIMRATFEYDAIFEVPSVKAVTHSKHNDIISTVLQTIDHNHCSATIFTY